MANVLDPSLIKDLSNHIYEKRKATAYQIESLTKAALARNDSQTIYKILNELTELTNGGTNAAKMGAITALGSVSVALGSFAIAYFLDEIIKPIFSTFRDIDARVRYYACESLYNIAKIARGEILLYFNEVFDILCMLVTDTESSVKNAADILDRLVKDIVSAKSTSYVSILQQQEGTNEIQSHLVDADGVAIQVNQEQDAEKAFSLPKFIPTLLERMYVIDPFAKKFLISWLELFDDIPSLELITFLPNFLEPLLKFLMNSSPSDVRQETENILNVFLKEIKAIYKVKFEVKRKSREREEKKDRALEQEHLQIPNTPQSQLIENDPIGSRTPSPLEVSDSASIKSNSTTIVRKTEPELTSLVAEEYDGDILLNGQDIFIDYPKIIDILLSFIRVSGDNTKLNDLLNEPHEIYLEIQLIVLNWLQEILETDPIGFIKYIPDCVSVILKNISVTDNEKDFELRNQFLSFNVSLQRFLVKFAESTLGQIDDKENLIYGLNREVYDDFIEFQLPHTLDGIVKDFLTSSNELSRITSLEWLIFLYGNNPSPFFIFVGAEPEDEEKADSEEEKQQRSNQKFDVTELIKSASNSSNEVILKVLQLLLTISEDNQSFFKEFMVKLIKLLERETIEKSSLVSLSRSKIEFIIRKLCVTLNSERIFKTLSEVLVTLDDLDFLNIFVVTLNNILLTTQELASFRKKLKNLDVYKLEDWSLFATLFQSWCHNAPSALSLCLLTSNYELAYLIIKNLLELEVNFQLLTQLDILVQLLESPIFLKLRLQLLEPEKHPFLYKTLYGLLMILPQSSTFTTLKNRLGAIAHVHNSGILSGGLPGVIPLGAREVSTGAPSAVTTPGGVNQLSIKKKRIYEMLDKFNKVQDKHEEYNINRKYKGSHDERNNHYQPTHQQSHQMSHTVTTPAGNTGPNHRMISYSDKRDYFSNSPAVVAATAAAAAAGSDTRRFRF